MRNTIIVWLASVFAAAAISAGVTARVQTNRADQARVLSGSDIGFRVEGMKRETQTDTLTGRRTPVDLAVGQFVVRVNGEWVEVRETVGPSRLTQ